MNVMNVSEQMVQAIRLLLKQAPLGVSEFRRIPGMGELYIARKSETDTTIGDNYRYLYTLEIDGENYAFFGGTVA